MRYICILFLLLSGCSAQFHLNRALQKDPSILDIQADTTISVNLSYIDTTIIINENKPVKIVSDTIKIKDTIKTKESIKFPKKHFRSSDNIAHAELTIFDNNISLKVWSEIDTVIKLQKKLNITTRQKDSLIEITKQQKAKITEEENWKQKVLRWAEIIAWIVGIAFGMWIIIQIIKNIRHI